MQKNSLTKLPVQLRKKKKLYSLWKQGQALQEDYRVVAFACRKKTSKIKVQLSLKMASVASETNKVFFKNAISKRSRKILGQYSLKRVT